jgi:hypothetical protein
MSVNRNPKWLDRKSVEGSYRLLADVFFGIYNGFAAGVWGI